MTKYKYLIPIEPRTKKNSQQIRKDFKTGKYFIGQSEEYYDFEYAASYFLHPKPARPISTPVTVKCTFYRGSKHNVDTSNLNAAIHDILVKYGILADDNRDIIASTDGTRTYYDKDNPRVEIEITPFKEEGYEQWAKNPKKRYTKSLTERRGKQFRV